MVVLEDAGRAVGWFAAVETDHRRARRTGLFDVAKSWVVGRAEVRIERERRETLATVLDRLPPGAEMVDRDSAGRLRIIRTPLCTGCSVVTRRSTRGDRY
jgi:hypothetical protein